MRRGFATFVLSLLVACAGDARDELSPVETGVGAETGDGDGNAGNGDDGSPLFDVGDGMGTGADDGGSDKGCEKVDFLFVVDNSASMFDNQQNLIKNYPGFMESITDTLGLDDFHVMVVDTDELMTCGDGCGYWNGPGPCPWYETPCNTTAEQAEAKTECDSVLGAGVINPMGSGTSGEPCAFAGDQRYMTAAEPDLTEAFACAAQVGVAGDGNERQMEALLRAMGSELGKPGACNEGFLRDDAILVVTLLTDEAGDAPDDFDVEQWRQPLIAAKGGNEGAVVMLGLLSDADFDHPGVCSGAQVEYAAKFIELVESLEHGSWASVCESDYQPFFEAAAGVVNDACEEFVPPG